MFRAGFHAATIFTSLRFLHSRLLMQEELQPELAVGGWNETPNTFSPLDECCGCRQAQDTLSHLHGHLPHPSSPRPALEQCGTRRPPPDTPGWAPAAPGAPWSSSEGKPWGRDAFLTQESPRPVPWCSAPLPAQGCVVLPVPARSIAPHAASPAAWERSGSQWLAPVFILR